MLLPGLLYYVVFRYLPMYGVTLAFKDYDFAGGVLGSPWAAPLYRHFEMFVSSPYFPVLMGNTFVISAYKLAAGIFPPIILAIMLTECRRKRYRQLVQSISFFPYFLSWVIVYGIMMALLSQSSGLLNRWIVMLTGKPVPFLTSPQYFRSLLVISSVWRLTGFDTVVYVAAINNIDPALYEAARIDGASRLQAIRRITLPGIASVIAMLLTIRIGTILDASFEQIFVMYNIEVYSVADIIDTWVYRTGLQQLNFSLASAVGLFKAVISCSLVLIANGVARKVTGREYGENEARGPAARRGRARRGGPRLRRHPERSAPDDGRRGGVSPSFCRLRVGHPARGSHPQRRIPDRPAGHIPGCLWGVAAQIDPWRRVPGDRVRHAGRNPVQRCADRPHSLSAQQEESARPEAACQHGGADAHVQRRHRAHLPRGKGCRADQYAVGAHRSQVIWSQYLIILKNFMERIPEELLESARIDGASEIRTLWSIVTPLCVPILITVAIYYGVAHWNEFQQAILYITQPKLWPLQVIVRDILTANQQVADRIRRCPP
jgi:putative aldouronate transport system permease protein